MIAEAHPLDVAVTLHAQLNSASTSWQWPAPVWPIGQGQKHPTSPKAGCSVQAPALPLGQPPRNVQQQAHAGSLPKVHHHTACSTLPVQLAGWFYAVSPRRFSVHFKKQRTGGARWQARPRRKLLAGTPPWGGQGVPTVGNIIKVRNLSKGQLSFQAPAWPATPKVIPKNAKDTCILPVQLLPNAVQSSPACFRFTRVGNIRFKNTPIISSCHETSFTCQSRCWRPSYQASIPRGR